MPTNIVPFPFKQSEDQLLVATVSSIAEKNIIIEVNGQLLEAGLAFSCLVKPQPGDRVLVSSSDREYWLLAILERPSEQNMALEFPAHVTMTAPHGSFALHARNDLSTVVGGENRMIATKTSIQGGALSVAVETLHSMTREIEAQTGKASLVADTLSTVTERLIQRAGTVLRWVEGLESVTVKQLVQTVRQSLLSRSKHASHTAETDFMINGQRIHMG